MSLYYESHITIEPVFGSKLETFKEIAFLHGFRVAKLLMDKGELSTKDSFCTSRGDIYDELCVRTHDCVQELQEHGFVVFRYKIEDTLIDSRIFDKFQILGEQYGYRKSRLS